MIKKVTFGSLPIPDQPTRRRDEVFFDRLLCKENEQEGH
jgi:hypothetical protein